MNSSKNKRSPLKVRPLRQAGQSVEEYRFDLIYRKVFTPLALAWVLIIFAGAEWARYYFKLPPNPYIYSAAALLGVVYAVFQIWHAWPQLQQLRLARDGEKFIGQFLESLRQLGFHVFHDLQGKGFNVDHVLVGPRGVFTVETKTYSKASRGESKIMFDGESVLVDGYTPDRNSVTQARAQASWLQGVLQASTGREFPVRPVVIYVGWYVEKAQGAKSDVWVLNEKALPRFIEHERESLSNEDVHLISDRISIHVRNSN